MDFPATQVYENDDDFMPTQKIGYPFPDEQIEQIGVLNVESDSYPINKGINKIGRHPGCNIVLNNSTVSKLHAEIEACARDAPAWICDTNSSNRTKLNNLSIRPGRSYELKNGSVIEFGHVRAIYKTCSSMDDSMIPETPMLNRKKYHTIISETPDPLLNNSSILANDISIIPSTQTEKKEAAFRSPQKRSLPEKRESIKMTKRIIIDESLTVSNCDDSQNSSMLKKDEDRVSINNKKKDEVFESKNELNDNVHYVETQKADVSSTKSLRICTNTEQGDISEVETQHDVDIHDVETQRNFLDLHELETQNVLGNVSGAKTVESTNIYDIETQKFENIEKTGETSKGNCSVHDMETQKLNINEITVHVGSGVTSITSVQDTKVNSEHGKIIEKNRDEFLKLSLTNNFEENGSDSENNDDLFESQNLLEGFVENSMFTYPTSATASTPAKSPLSKDIENDTSGKHTDDEDIFNAVTQRADNKFEDALSHKYSSPDRQGKITETCNRNLIMNSEDSSTDEEGHFAEIAVNKRQALSLSSQEKQDKVNKTKTDLGTSNDSDDMFDLPTQRVNVRRESNSSEVLNEIQDDVKEVDPDAITQKWSTSIETKVPSQVDPDAPTQRWSDIAETTKKKCDLQAAYKFTETYDQDDTQILGVNEFPSARSPSFIESKEGKTKSIPQKQGIIDIGEDTPTQIIVSPVSVRSNNCDISSDKLAKQNSNSMGEPGPNNIENGTAPTQLINDLEIEQREKVSIGVVKRSRKCNSSNKPKFDDSLERNLNEMFDNVDEEDICNVATQLSTQALEKALESSQIEEGLSVSKLDVDDLAQNKVKKQKRGRKSGTSTINTRSQRLSNKKSLKGNITNADNDLQDIHISTPTSPRRCNVLADSQDNCGSATFISSPRQNLKHNAEKHDPTNVTAHQEDTSNSVNAIIDKIQGNNTSSSLQNSLNGKKNTEEPSVSDPILQKADPCVKIIKDTVSRSPSSNINIFCTSENNKRSLELPTAWNNVDNDGDDFLAGFPPVRISGTLSNPASPSSSTSTVHQLRYVLPKSKNETISKRPTRKLQLSQRNSDDDDIEFMNFPKNISLPVSRDVNIDDNSRVVGDTKNVPEKKNSKCSNQSKKKIADSNDSNSLIDSKESIVRSPSVQSNRMTRNFSKKNLDSSSVFQVAKSVLTENVSNKSAAKIALNKTSQYGKRTLRTMGEIEKNDVKKFKTHNIDKVDIPSNKRRRKTEASDATTDRRQSETNINFLTKKNSPLIMEYSTAATSNDKTLFFIKSPVVEIHRMSPNELKEHAVSKHKIETKQNRRTVVDNSSPPTKPSTSANNIIKSTATTSSIANVKKTTRREIKSKEDSGSEAGDESQEVEMIMKRVLSRKSPSISEAEKQKTLSTSTSTRNVRTRNSRKRLNNSKSIETNISSDRYESDNSLFEAPIIRAKRTKNSTSSISINRTTNESIVKKKSNKWAPRSTSSEQTITDSSEGNFEGSRNSVAHSVTLGTTLKKRGSKKKVEKLQVDKTNETIKESSSSRLDSSSDNTSIISTPCRTRRSMNSSFLNASVMSNKAKQKILFTFVTADYTQLLKKLGAYEVQDPAKCSVLVTDKIRRSVKFLCALSMPVPIVSTSWLLDSEKAGQLLDVEKYILKDPSTEAKFGFRLRGSLERAKKQKLLEGYTVILTTNVKSPPISELRSMIASCGGKALIRPPNSWSDKTVIISSDEDLSKAKKILAKAPKTVTVQSPEFLLSGILQQQLNFVKFKLT